ncbi:beta-ketoacyl synthase N-terminal-like domain-containing protein [Streptomyces sp. NPDC007205]|uniref:beta-ketoacyl synthase N-terminal-like domain-containing protein n=1 Tax=Streptomyces sp. NPDC007205 TaxID=3154316 RepID=UPI003402A800
MRGQVAVVGMGIAVPGASDLDQFWELLNAGKPVFTEPGGRFRLAAFHDDVPRTPDRSYARVSGYWDGAGASLRLHTRVAREIADGRLSAHAHSTVWLRHCLAQALDGVTACDTDAYAFFVGASVAGSQQTEEATVVEAVARGMSERLGREHYGRIRERLRRRYGMVGPHPPDALPTQVARAAATGLLPEGYVFGVVDAACASTLYAIDLGAKSILAGDAAIACCGGYFTVGPRFNVLFSKLSGLSPTGEVRVFGQDADGTLFSDAASVVVLKNVDRAIADGDRIWGVLGGFGTSSDGAGKAIFAPNPAGQRLCLERARAAAAVTADDTSWVLAHGTGTRAGDAVELAVLEELAPPGGYVCTSNKSVIGHGGWNAGGVSVVHALLAMHHASIPAQHGLAHSDGTGLHRVRIPLRSVALPRRRNRPRAVGVSSFGFGGINSHLILRDPADPPAATGQPLVPETDPVVAVAWTAHLPGDPCPADAVRTLSDGKGVSLRFGSYEPLSFAESRLPPKVLRAIDRGQQMALRVADRFVTEHGELWAPLRAATGVVAVQQGPVRLSMDNALRCYAADLTTVFEGEDAATLQDLLGQRQSCTPPSSQTTLAGTMPNVLAARLANRYDLHGLTLHLDTGLDSGLAAADVASRYLRTGELAMALLLAVSADSRPDFAGLVGVDADRIAEGAFLLALTLESTARQRQLPILGRIRTTVDDPHAGHTGAVVSCRRPDRATYLAADGIITLISALHAPEYQTTVVPEENSSGVRVTVESVPARDGSR